MCLKQMVNFHFLHWTILQGIIHTIHTYLQYKAKAQNPKQTIIEGMKDWTPDPGALKHQPVLPEVLLEFHLLH